LPSSGRAIVLDEELSTADPEWLRPRVGLASAAMLKRFDPDESVSDAVVSAAYAAAQARGREIDEIDIRRARRVLGEWGLGELTSRTFGTLSEGEQKRLQLARAIMTDPELLLLDEPTAGLDMAARSDLLRLLGAFAQVASSPAIVVVTHHIEEIPAGFTHALVLRDGSVVAAGNIFETVTSDVLSAAYGVGIEVNAIDGGFRAHVAF
jgi:iron complex transport system ATP-binding protein